MARQMQAPILGADNNYDMLNFVRDCRAEKVTPYVVLKTPETRGMRIKNLCKCVKISAKRRTKKSAATKCAVAL